MVSLLLVSVKLLLPLAVVAFLDFEVFAVQVLIFAVQVRAPLAAARAPPPPPPPAANFGGLNVFIT
jgi:hypothetical protein